MSINVLPSEKLAVVGTIDPGTVNSTPANSDIVDMADYHQLFAILLLGDMAAETIDFKLEQGQDSGMTGAKDLVVATQLAASAAANDNDQIILEIRQEDLDLVNGFTHVRAEAVTGGATGGPACILMLGVDARFEPVAHLASVLEVAYP